MTLWIVWSSLVSIPIAGAGAAVEHAAALVRAPRRFVWIAAILATTLVPLVLALWPARATVIAAVETRSMVRLTARSAPPTLAYRMMVSGERLVRRADPWVASGWALLSVALLAALVRSVIGLRREQSRWDETEVDMYRVLVATDAGPAVVGFWQPRVVIPTWALSADNRTREMLLRHEWEHVCAGDSRSLLGSEFLRMLFPWNASLSWMIRRLRLAIEIDCDARVIRGGGDAREYGMMLLAVGERFTTAHPLVASLTEPHLNLEARINAMSQPRPRRPLAAALAFAGLAVVMLTAAARAPRPNPLVTARLVEITDRVAPQPIARSGEQRDPSKDRPAPAIASRLRAVPSATPPQPIPTSSSAELPAVRDTTDTSARIIVEFQDTDIRDVVRAFARFSGRTIAVDQGVTGSVTASIKDQPWKTALRSILLSQGLSAIEDSTGVITIARNSDIAGEPHVGSAFGGLGYVLIRRLDMPNGCQLFLMDGVLQSSCAVPAKKSEVPKCDVAVPVFVIDGVVQSAPCPKPETRDFSPSYTYVHKPR